MIKKLLPMALLTVAMGAWAQSVTTTKMNVQSMDGTTQVFTVAADSRVTWVQETHEYVDLGLPSGTMWATCNVGATEPTEPGDLFGWGETSPHYTSITYKPEFKIEWKKAMQFGYSAETYWNAIKGDDGQYHDQHEWSVLPYDKETLLLKPEYDAAHVNWGGEWRIPTLDEMQELMDNCYWSYMEDFEGSGMAGYLVTSMIEGYTDKSIFLPMSGYINHTTYSNTATNYWLANYSTTFADSGEYRKCQSLQLWDKRRQIDPAMYRHNGEPVRPVFTKKTK